jgi:hypothetical protein
MRRYSLTIFMVCSLSAMHLSVPLSEIVVTDDLGVVERIPVGAQTVEREMTLWAMHELMASNKDLKEQLKSAKTKWYVAAAGVATTVIPLVVCGVELYLVTSSCD